MANKETRSIGWTKQRLLEYADKYETKFPCEVEMEDEFLRWFREHRYLDKLLFVRMGKWKTPRQIKNYIRNDDVFVREITARALATSDERLRIMTLQQLHGVSWAVGSVMLHFAFANYPILDFRALWSLYLRKPKSYSFDFWRFYVKKFRRIMKETGLSARKIDRGLWMYSKEHQRNNSNMFRRAIYGIYLRRKASS